MPTARPSSDTAPRRRRALGYAAVYAVAGLAALATAAWADHGSTPMSFGWIAWGGWVALPYALYGAVSVMLQRKAHGRPIDIGVALATTVIVGFTAAAYRGIWFGPHHSTEGLIFIFAPLWLLLGAPIVFAASYAVAHLLARVEDGVAGP